MNAIQRRIAEAELAKAEADAKRAQDAATKAEFDRKVAERRAKVVDGLNLDDDTHSYGEDFVEKPPKKRNIVWFIVLAFLAAVIALMAIYVLRLMKPQNASPAEQIDMEVSTTQASLSAVSEETATSATKPSTTKAPATTTKATTTTVKETTTEEPKMTISIQPTEEMTSAKTTQEYTFISGKYTWEKAEAYCEEHGGHLATIHSESEWAAIMDVVSEARKTSDIKYVWLGATSQLSDDMRVSFKWVDNSDTSYIINSSHWFYNENISVMEPSGYDAYEYMNNGNIIREPYLLLWNVAPKKGASTEWSLNDVPDVSDYSQYKDSNMGFILQKDTSAAATTAKAAAATTVKTTTLPPATEAPTSAAVYTCYKEGQINGGTVPGYTTSYVVQNGSKTTVRDKLSDGWHITAYNYCDSHGIRWYEVYDTDDGDYYGWVNSDYLYFYPEGVSADDNVEVWSCDLWGEISGTGVAGFTTSYVVNNGSKTTVRDTLGNGWHVTARNYCYSKGIYWYELYDSDDGDYYGWVDENYIYFY